jgi:hypothetical protein
MNKEDAAARHGRIDWSERLAAHIKAAEIPTSFTQQLSAMKLAQRDFLASDSVKKIFDSIAETNKILATSRISDEYFRVIDQNKLAWADIARSFEINQRSLTEVSKRVLASIEDTRSVFAKSFVSDDFRRTIDSFRLAEKSWRIPDSLVESTSAFKALQDDLGDLSLPVLDRISARAFAEALGKEGIDVQLAELEVPTSKAEVAKSEDLSSGVEEPAPFKPWIGPRAMELMQLWGILASILIPFYQEIQSHAIQQKNEEDHAYFRSQLDLQIKQLEALSKIVEKAIIKESRRNETMFVVRQRAASIRSKPVSGASIIGSLLPRETVRLMSERGKWVEVEYYNGIARRYSTGWVLKKYLTRVQQRDMN